MLGSPVDIRRERGEGNASLLLKKWECKDRLILDVVNKIEDSVRGPDCSQRANLESRMAAVLQYFAWVGFAEQCPCCFIKFAWHLYLEWYVRDKNFNDRAISIR